MRDLTELKPLDRFGELASGYAKHRPNYPSAALDYALERCRVSADAVFVDVGCGTGISSRWFAERGFRVIGIEPNDDMRTEAMRHASGAGVIEYRKGTAEQTGLGDESTDVVVAAQAFHWFRQDEALAEQARILKPGGWALLIWNIRDHSDAFTADYGDVILSFPDAAKVERPEEQYVEALMRHPRFQCGERVTFANEQPLTLDGLMGRTRSISYSPRDADGIARVSARLRAIFERYQTDGTVTIRYHTIVGLAQKR